MCVVICMYLEYPPDYIDSKNIWVHGSNSLGQVFLLKYYFGIFTLHRERVRCGQMGPSPCYSQSEVVYVYQVLDQLLQGFFWQKHHI